MLQPYYISQPRYNCSPELLISELWKYKVDKTVCEIEHIENLKYARQVCMSTKDINKHFKLTIKERFLPEDKSLVESWKHSLRTTWKLI